MSPAEFLSAALGVAPLLASPERLLVFERDELHLEVLRVPGGPGAAPWYFAALSEIAPGLSARDLAPPLAGAPACLRLAEGEGRTIAEALLELTAALRERVH